MTTIINTPSNGESGDGVASILMGILLTIIVAALFFIYVMPKVNNPVEAPKANSIDVNVKLPSTTGAGATQ